MVVQIKVGNVYVDGLKIVYAPPGFPAGIKWAHVIPKKYNHNNLPKSCIFCFTNTKRGRDAMDLWLRNNHLADFFRRDENNLNKVKKFTATRVYKRKERFLLRLLRERIRRDTQEYLDRLLQMGLDPWDPGILKQINTPESWIEGSFTHCSTVFKEKDYGQGHGQELSTDDVMLLSDPTFIPILAPPWPAPPEWNNAISSAQVDSGCLRLFENALYGGVFLFLWGPNGYYPDLADFAFDDKASSLQQN